MKLQFKQIIDVFFTNQLQLTNEYSPAYIHLLYKLLLVFLKIFTNFNLDFSVNV